jgi:hypothetical protein
MLAANDYLTRPDFADRCREVRADLDAGEPMTLGQIADRLEMPFDISRSILPGKCSGKHRSLKV